MLLTIDNQKLICKYNHGNIPWFFTKKKRPNAILHPTKVSRISRIFYLPNFSFRRSHFKLILGAGLKSRSARPSPLINI